MDGKARAAAIEQAIAELGEPWTHAAVYARVKGSHGFLTAYLKARRAGGVSDQHVINSPEAEAEAVESVTGIPVTEFHQQETAVPSAPPAPVPPLAAAKAHWVGALTQVEAFEQRLRPRGRAEDAEYQALGMRLNRQFIAAETAWRPLELQAQQAVTTVLVHQAQLGRGSRAEQARCEAALQEALAALRSLVGPGMDPLTTVAEVQALLVPPTIGGHALLPPLI
jgi:hypothetical protein